MGTEAYWPIHSFIVSRTSSVVTTDPDPDRSSYALDSSCNGSSSSCCTLSISWRSLLPTPQFPSITTYQSIYPSLTVAPTLTATPHQIPSLILRSSAASNTYVPSTSIRLLVWQRTASYCSVRCDPGDTLCDTSFDRICVAREVTQLRVQISHTTLVGQRRALRVPEGCAYSLACGLSATYTPPAISTQLTTTSLLSM